MRTVLPILFKVNCFLIHRIVSCHRRPVLECRFLCDQLLLTHLTLHGFTTEEAGASGEVGEPASQDSQVA